MLTAMPTDILRFIFFPPLSDQQHHNHAAQHGKCKDPCQDQTAHAQDDRPHVAVQGAVLVAIGHFAVVDDDIVAVAAAGPARHLHIAAGGCVDGRAARGGKVGTGVEFVDPVTGFLRQPYSLEMRL